MIDFMTFRYSQEYITKQEADRTAEFLNAAAMGNTAKIREVNILWGRRRFKAYGI